MLKVKSRRSARGLREELADTASVNLYSSWTNAESFWSFRFFVGGRGASMFGGGDGVTAATVLKAAMKAAMKAARRRRRCEAG